jgi:hypothetical protein
VSEETSRDIGPDGEVGDVALILQSLPPGWQVRGNADGSLTASPRSPEVRDDPGTC